MPKGKRSDRSILADIRKQQNSTKHIIPQTSFHRLVSECVQDLADASEGRYSIRTDAVEAIQCMSENYITDLFQQAQRLANYNNRETVTREDLNFILRDDNATSPPAFATGTLPPPPSPAPVDPAFE